MNEIKKPKNRSLLRKKIGREFYIFKRYLSWFFSSKKFARKRKNQDPAISVFKHRSLILRPLQGLDMQLQRNKRKNLEIAIKKLDEIIILPGETFSLWRQVGRPTKYKGYLEGLVLKNGTISSGTGGGLCQLGNLLFWVFAHSPLKITERHRHGYDVFPDLKRKVPFGAGATLAYNYIDLQIFNPTNYIFKISLNLDETHLNGELFSSEETPFKYKIIEKNHQIKQQVWGGYSRHNQIFKITKFKGDETEELITENHAIMMYQPFIENI